MYCGETQTDTDIKHSDLEGEWRYEVFATHAVDVHTGTLDNTHRLLHNILHWRLWGKMITRQLKWASIIYLLLN